jgi:hypothetical protein
MSLKRNFVSKDFGLRLRKKIRNLGVSYKIKNLEIKILVLKLSTRNLNVTNNFHPSTFMIEFRSLVIYSLRKFKFAPKTIIINFNYFSRRDHGVLLTKFEYKSKVTNLEKSVKINEINQDISSLFLNKGPLFR